MTVATASAGDLPAGVPAHLSPDWPFGSGRDLRRI